MKPRTHIQQEVAHLSKRLPRLTATQKAYAFRHCFKHYAIKRADGTNICTECGHSWKSDHDLADTLCGCTCPHCGMQLEALRTRKSVFSENEYFSIVTTSKQYQVIRFFFINKAVWRLPVTADKFPVKPFLPYNNTLYYGLTINPVNSEVYIADAIDYVQNGVVLRYSPDGELLDEFYVGIIPGAFCWR